MILLYFKVNNMPNSFCFQLSLASTTILRSPELLKNSYLLCLDAHYLSTRFSSMGTTLGLCVSHWRNDYKISINSQLWGDKKVSVRSLLTPHLPFFFRTCEWMRTGYYMEKIRRINNISVLLSHAIMNKHKGHIEIINLHMENDIELGLIT